MSNFQTWVVAFPDSEHGSAFRVKCNCIMYCAPHRCLGRCIYICLCIMKLPITRRLGSISKQVPHTPQRKCNNISGLHMLMPVFTVILPIKGVLKQVTKERLEPQL